MKHRYMPLIPLFLCGLTSCNISYLPHQTEITEIKVQRTANFPNTLRIDAISIYTKNGTFHADYVTEIENDFYKFVDPIVATGPPDARCIGLQIIKAKDIGPYGHMKFKTSHRLITDDIISIQVHVIHGSACTIHPYKVSIITENDQEFTICHRTTDETCRIDEMLDPNQGND